MINSNIILIITIIIIIICCILIIEFYCYLNRISFHELLNPKLYNQLELYDINNKEDNVLFNLYNQLENYINNKEYNINNKEYLEKIKEGYIIMKNTKIVIGGLFKDSANKFELFKKRINNLSKYFKNLQVVIFENDSSDNSRILLLDWEKNQSNIHIIKLLDNEYCLLKKKSPVSYGMYSNKRMILMAKYRNYIKEYVDINYNDYDYYTMIDTDTTGPLNINGLAHAFSTQSTLNWDMIAANGKTGYLSTTGKLMYYDTLAIYNYNKSKEYNIKNLSYITLYLNFINNKPLKVDCAFGGFAIYKMSSVKNVNYTPADGKYICEHTIFTNNMKLNGHSNFYIEPKLIFLVGKQGPHIFGSY